jgi:iron complex outermembrane receptor protein
MRMMVRAALLAATILTPGVALAQTAPAATTADDSASTSGDIIVTARKVAESIQSVPVSITAFTDTEIKSARIESLEDVAKLTPGLNYTPLFGKQNQLPIIRGAAQTFGQLNVGVFLDGIYLSGKAGVDLELNDLERIEVIKGPQSALYGRNTFAGAINYITKHPSKELTGRAEFTAGNNGLYKGQASISGPISQTLAFRVGGFYRTFDGYYRSAIDGGRVDFEKGYGAIGTLEWTPSSDFTATVRFSYSNDDDGQPASNVIRNNTGLGTPSGGSATQQRNLLYIGKLPSIPINGVLVDTTTAPGQPSPYGDREENIRGSATLEYHTGPVSITSITSYSKRNAEYTYDGDNTICDRAGGCPNFGFPFAPAIPIGSTRFALSSNVGYYRDASQEIRVQSSGNTHIDWLVGFFYYNNITQGVDRGFSPTTTSGATAYSAFNPNYSYPLTRILTNSYSGFGSATWHATSKFSITGEVRYEYETQDFRQCPTYYAQGTTPGLGVAECGAQPSPIASTTFPFTGSQTVFPSPAGTPATFSFTGTHQTFDFVTPRVILDYKVNPDVLLYASYARGAKTGGFNTGLNVFPNQRTYNPEKADNYEVGLKSDLFDKRLRFNVAGYYIDWHDQQAACQNPITAGGSSTNRTYTCNVATSKIYGAEVEMAARLTDFFSISANYTYTHARYTSFVDDSLAQTLALAGQPAVNFNGNHLPYVPDHKIVISPRFTIPIAGLTVEARGDLQYQSNTYLRADNLAYFGDKTVVDLRLQTEVQGFSVQLFANNVFDSKAPVAGVRFFDSVNYSISSPQVTGPSRREFGLTLGYKF